MLKSKTSIFTNMKYSFINILSMCKKFLTYLYPVVEMDVGKHLCPPSERINGHNSLEDNL